MSRLIIHWNFLSFKGGAITLVIFISIACHLTYNVRNQHDTLEEVLFFPCGKVTIELIGRGNSKFIFRQRFDLDQLIFVSPDSLKILYNDGTITSGKMNFSDIIDDYGFMEIGDDQVIDVPFECKPQVFDGDTFRIYAPAYIKCNDVCIDLDTINFSFINNLRIYGVNTPN